MSIQSIYSIFEDLLLHEQINVFNAGENSLSFTELT